MSRRGTSLATSSLALRLIGDGSDYTSGPKGDNGDDGPTGPTGPVGPTGPTGSSGGSIYALIYSADFTEGISGSTGPSGATGALTSTDSYDSSNVWFPQVAIFYQDGAATVSSSTVQVYVDDVAISAVDTLSRVTGDGTYQVVSCLGGPVITGSSPDVYVEAVGDVSCVKVYLYATTIE